MTDYITHEPVWGFNSASFGFKKMTDNHGNSQQGLNLSCASGVEKRLSLAEYYSAQFAFAPYVFLDRTTDGITRLGNMESPLKTLCDRATARLRHDR